MTNNKFLGYYILIGEIRVYAQGDCRSFENPLHYSQQRDHKGSSGSKVIFQDLTSRLSKGSRTNLRFAAQANPDVASKYISKGFEEKNWALVEGAIPYRDCQDDMGLVGVLSRQ